LNARGPLFLWALLLGAYLLGSISFSYLVVKFLQGRDVRTVGSGNAGATNVMRAAGKAPALLVLLLDVGKGVAAVTVSRLLEAPAALVGGAAFAVVLGHVFPIFFGFRGGKGVATAAGAMGGLDLLALALALLVFLGLVVWRHYVSLGSVAAALVFPFAMLLTQQLGWSVREPQLFWWSLALSGLVVGKHRTNLRRLLAGNELRLGRAQEED
jgi:glycerol-3-phosphate acyltransferase PlsY